MKHDGSSSCLALQRLHNNTYCFLWYVICHNCYGLLFLYRLIVFAAATSSAPQSDLTSLVATLLDSQIQHHDGTIAVGRYGLRIAITQGSNTSVFGKVV